MAYHADILLPQITNLSEHDGLVITQTRVYDGSSDSNRVNAVCGAADGC